MKKSDREVIGTAFMLLFGLLLKLALDDRSRCEIRESLGALTRLLEDKWGIE